MTSHYLGGKRRAGGGLAMALLALTMTVTTVKAQSVTIDFVSVGYAGNASDPLTNLGSVNYEYQIGKFEVTNGQYVAFLNAAAKSNEYGLYNSNMATAGAFGGGITQSGSLGNYSYSVKSGYETKPVNHVSYWDAARFANWVGTGYTEGRATPGGSLLQGAAYDLNFSLTPTTLQGNRLLGATIALPTRDEWYKAAYYQPQSAGGPSDDYWLFPTQSDLAPLASGPSALSNRANFGNSLGVTNVGSYAGSASFFGTFDQGGNVSEWNATDVASGFRDLRGGSFPVSALELRSVFSFAGPDYPSTYEGVYVGFRVASLAPIPEPSTYAAIVGLASLGVAMWRRRAGRPALRF